jgi:hypothetical protein
MIDLAEKTVAELDSLAQEQRAMISRDPRHSRAELGDVEWEMEKRHWRKDAVPASNLQVAKAPEARSENNEPATGRVSPSGQF